MSHVVMNTNDKAKIISISALKLACDMMGTVELIQGAPGKTKYRTWKTDHGKLVGDWDVPTGMTSAQVGENADYVVRANENGRKLLNEKGYDKPYEIGVVWVPEEKCYRLVYDFFNEAAGLEHLVGHTKVDRTARKSGNLQTSCPLLIQHYNVARDTLAAGQNGDTLTVIKQLDGSLLVGSPGEPISLPGGVEIKLGAGDMIAEIHTGSRVS